MSRTQQELEREAARIQGSPAYHPEKSVEEVFGPPGEWKTEVGPYLLMLLPFNLQWWWYDRVHETWEDTGYNAGEVVFTVRDGELSPRRRDRVSVPAGPAKGTPSPAGFCTSCGTPLSPGKRFCSNCGDKIRLA
jgi:hypothetical protein